MTLRQWAAELGVSYATVAYFKKEGMPEELEAAKAWVAIRKVNKRKARFIQKEAIELPEGEDADEMVTHLREIERALSACAHRAYKANQVPEAITLRREHVAAIKAIYDAQAKAIKINESRSKLFSVDRCLNMINDCMQAAAIMWRRLPDLAQSLEERKKLEAFLNGVLAEIKTVAVDSLKRAA